MSAGSPQMLAEVAVAVPLDQTFTYEIPESWHGRIRIGQRVLVPFGARRLTGHVVDVGGNQKKEEAPKRSLKPLLDLLDPEPLFAESLLDFFRWVAKYYHANLGEVLRTATPSGLNLKSFRQAYLTEEGRQRFDPRSIESPVDHVLKQLSERSPLRCSSLLRQDGITEGLLQRMVRDQWITIRSELSNVRVKVKTERFVKVRGDVSLESLDDLGLRGKKQREVLEFLLKRGELAAASLERELPGSRSILNRLIQRSLIDLDHRETERLPDLDGYREATSGEIVLNPCQQAALSAVELNLQERKHQTYLLFGVTGSGKTEVYLQAAAKCLGSGRQVLILVPEISLTGQMVARFRARFGSRIAVAHSGLSDGERYDQWRKIVRGEVDIVIGARSAVFAPLDHIGLVVVDEEHESSYKQETGLLYHGRDVAIARARFAGAVALLGSATPSLESFHRASEGRYQILRLDERVENRPLPEVRLIDMTKAPLVYRVPNQEYSKPRAPLFSKEMLDELESCLARKEQAILFLNRRGYAPILLCTSCGQVRECPHCAISLTLYRSKAALVCHYCEYSEPVSKTCGPCETETLVPMGTGTESVEEEVAVHFPEARIVRLDRDTASTKGSHQRILQQVNDGEADILIGTQMVAKGHHFPNVTFVGVLAADVSLHMPDFRAAERTFQLLTQVAGRAGRGDKPGRVLVQTYSVDHFSLQAAKRHAYEQFVQEELEQRQGLSYPPYSRLVCLRLSGDEEGRTLQASERIRKRVELLFQHESSYREHIRVLGPAPAPKARLRDQFRYQLLLKSSDARLLHRFVFQLRRWLSEDEAMKKLTLQVDIDPMNLM